MRAYLLTLVVGLGLVSSATAAPMAAPSGQPQATQESQRSALYPQVRKYLDEVAALEPEFLSPELEFSTRGRVPRWINKVCPQVAGLPEQDANAVLARFSQIARAAGVRMDDTPCRPDVLIYVTSHPKELVTGMVKHEFGSWFGYRGRPYLLDDFIATPRPIRVWYNLSGSQYISSVLVVADQTQLPGVSLGQFADYVTLASLAQIKPLAMLKADAHLGDAPTILKLFESPPQAASPGLSDWDQAFLKSLYSWPTTWRRALVGVDGLAWSMVGQMAP